MIVETLVVTPFAQNARIIVDPASKAACVVDPGGEVERIYDVVERLGATVETVFLTHAHIDHAGGVEPFRALVASKTKQRPKLMAHQVERDMRSSIQAQAMMFGVAPGEYQNVAEPERYVDEGDEVEIGELKGKVLFTPGHSPGHVSLYFETKDAPILIAGDTLFAGSIGRTDLPGGDHQTLINSIKSKILTLPADTVVMSGHGEDTTVAMEARGNPFLG